MEKLKNFDSIIIDRGHATLDEKGNYATAGKQYKFDDKLTVYEGFENQKYCEALGRFATLAGLRVQYTVQPCDPKDLSLGKRVAFANGTRYKDTTLFLSVHNNAGGGEGTEVFTSKGQTDSDLFAEEILNSITLAFPKRKMRVDNSDGDKDKEENFYVLAKTSMPAVLVEYGFFDNRKDYEFLSDPCNIDLMAEATIAGIMKAIKTK